MLISYAKTEGVRNWGKKLLSYPVGLSELVGSQAGKVIILFSVPISTKSLCDSGTRSVEPHASADMPDHKLLFNNSLLQFFILSRPSRAKPY